MLKFHAAEFVNATQFLVATQGLLRSLEEKGIGVDKDGVLSGAARKVSLIDDELTKLREVSVPLGLKLTVMQIDRILSTKGLSYPLGPLRDMVKGVRERFLDELSLANLYVLKPSTLDYYDQPRLGWAAVIDRFGCSFDVEEARKCIALERYTGAVFHLMRVVEQAVLSLQVFLKDEDPKAHFGSVLAKLEIMTQKTKYEHIPEHLRGNVQFMKDVLTQLHAVKDSWRDKVSHVNSLVPTGTFTEEMARGVHDATLMLMKKLVDGLPPRSAV